MEALLICGMLALSLCLDLLLVLVFFAHRPPSDNELSISQKSEGFFHTQYNEILTEVASLITEKVAMQRIEMELSNAREVQLRLSQKLFEDPPQLQSFANILTAETCSGDWWFSHSSERYAYYWVGDVVGHGVSSALAAATCRAILTTLTFEKEKPLLDLVSLLNEAFWLSFKGSSTSTFVCLRVEIESGDCEFINGSHPDPFLCAEGRSIFVESPDLFQPLGRSRKAEYQTVRHHLKKGDSVLLVSDGFMEISPKPGVRWTERSILKRLNKIMFESAPNEVNQRLVGELKDAISDGGMHEDDITLFSIFRT